MDETTLHSSNVKPWRGASLQNIYERLGPWGYEVTPIIASKHHTVLYDLTSLHPSFHIDRWDKSHVRMPFSAHNIARDKEENDKLNQCWEIIQKSLVRQSPISSSAELENAINSYNLRLPKFLALHHFFSEILEEEESIHFFQTIMPGIIQLALQLPELVPSLPILKCETQHSLSLNQLQIASILANAFLCAFPWLEHSTSCPGVNFFKLFAAHNRPNRQNCVAEKLKCICHYFRQVLSKTPDGVITFERKYIPKAHIPQWNQLDNNLGKTFLHVSTLGTIEDEGIGLLQVDFANKNVGGGVLSFGCVQEEIRFIICPELIASRLFTEQLGPHEALVITGIERFSSYSGYGDTFKWNGNYEDNTPFDSFHRRRTSVVAIDATRFNKPIEQYQIPAIMRELNKAHVGFHSHFNGKLAPVASGNWGCGAFRGDPKLKLLIQLMACNAAKRHLVYYTFGNSELTEEIAEMWEFLNSNQIHTSQLLRYLSAFSSQTSSVSPENLYPFIYQFHFDNKQKNINSSFPLSSWLRKTTAGPTKSSNNDVNTNENKNVAITDDQFNESMIVEDCSQDIVESSQKEQNIILPIKWKGHEHNQNELFNVISLCDRLDEPVVNPATNSFLSIVDEIGETRSSHDDVHHAINNSSGRKRKIYEYFSKVEHK